MVAKKGFAVSWFFAPYIGSADIDFFKRIKDSKFSFDVVQVARDAKDDRVLRFATATINRIEVDVDHSNPRTLHARGDFKRACLSIFEAHENEYSFLISHSNELISHDVAGDIKQAKPKIPWIAYFGDLFANNPYLPYIPNYPLVEEDVAIERRTIEAADLIIVNNEYQKRLMLSGDLTKYQEKFVVIPHCFDPQMYPSGSVARRGNDRFVFAHLGTLYHVKRTAEPVLRAVDRLIEIYPHYKGKFEINFYGGSPAAHDISVHAFMQNRNAVRFEEPVSYVDSLSIMKEADCLLLIDGIFNQDEDKLDASPFLPGKLMDYMGAGKPIMAVTMPKGPTADLLSSSGNILADDRIDRIAYVLKRYIDGKIISRDSDYQAFAVENIARRMDEAIRSTLKGANL